ncbi:MAG TPA: NADPH-dependent F420 reductase [Gemmataceae bacterium]|nr:NADPH-dependent F420 reductase [Gemmataceae bacterium]
MRIAIIGAGNVGSTLGKAWAKKGHDIFFGVRHPQDDKIRQLVESIGPKTQAGTVAEAASSGEAIVLATPWQGAEAAIRAAGDLRGKIVIDCTNPLKPDVSGLEVGFTTSGAEQVAQWAKGAKVFKAFNTTGSNNMADPVINGIRTVMFVCGDDEAAKSVVMQLAADLGFDAVDAGKLEQARLLEPWAMLWISLAFQGGMGRDFGFVLLRRGKANPA